VGAPGSGFTHLHVHSYYSFLDGASSPEALARRAADLGQAALALTDWFGLYGAIEHRRACDQAGIRPLYGAEVAIGGGDSGERTTGHLTLLVKDRTGWQSLCRLLTAAQLAGGKGRPVLTAAMLADNTVGIVCLSGCRHGVVAAPLLADDEDRALAAARWLRGLFGPDAWLELPVTRHPDERLLAARLADLGDRLGIGVVATGNVHYATADDAPLADILACVRTGTTLDAARDLRPNHRYDLADATEMAARCPRYPEALANTAQVAARCRFDLAFGRHSFPAMPIPPRPGGTVTTPDEHLRSLCRCGLTLRYAGGDPALWRRAARQMDHELAVIARLELAGFFLLVADVVREARDRGIPHQGRGSAAGSVVSYSLGISRVEPLANRLLFERFLSVERGSLPDIDIDFGHLRREEIIQYLYRTYGAARVAMACTVQRYHHRGAVRDIGKAWGIPAPLLETIARRVRQRQDDSLAQAIVAVVGEEAARTPYWARFADLCERLVDTPRHLGIHNGGMVITGPDLAGLVPLERATMENRVVLQWDKESLEQAGLIKLDILALQALDMLDQAAGLVREHEGVDLALERLPLDDRATYDLLCRADTIGAFQVESRAQIQFLPLHQPRDFPSLVAQISIIRPGPLQGHMVHPYLRRRAGEEPVTYPHPSLEPVLRDTAGVILYQEQVLETARALAGFTLGEGDELRRAMGSQRSRERMQALRERFIGGALANGVPESVAAEVFRQLEGFAFYGFPRSHATAFARLAYESVYLKAHHPVAFYCARLNAQPGGFYSPSVVVGDARRHGVRILGPHLAASAYDCALERDADRQLGVRLGLRYVRGLADTTGRAVVTERVRRGPYRDLRDLCRRGRGFLTPEAITALIAAGACDHWGLPRRTLLWRLPATWRNASGLPLPVADVALPAATLPERVAGELWATGLPLTAHPLATVRAALDRAGILPVAALDTAPEGATVTVAGLAVVAQAPPTAKGTVFLSIEDETGLGNAILSPGVARSQRSALHAAPIISVTGRVQRRGTTTNLVVQRLAPWGTTRADPA
jgi:error-prone DNA polymerase